MKYFQENLIVILFIQIIVLFGFRRHNNQTVKKNWHYGKITLCFIYVSFLVGAIKASTDIARSLSIKTSCKY